MRMQHGFSLIEMVIATAILAILAAIAVPSFAQMIQNSRIRTAAESIQNGLQVARAEAVKRNTMVKFQLNADSSWIACVIANAGDNCVNDPANADYIQGRSTAEGSTADVTATVTPAGNTTVVFTGLGLIAQGTNPFTQVDVDMDEAVMSPADSRDLRILLGAGGSVRMCNPNLGADDPRAC
ncbi:MAG: type II secretion system protein GspH [Betaproteobacteria bacterium HGW-Betaproteobacteria-8]|nr:MAG: type II secretion system protein GspH [Betaproteobacteria bacterium HGW-Betaproteobacteria-8]